LVKDILDIGSETILIPKPRRFGKTLNISMLKYYFEKCEKDYSYLKNLSQYHNENVIILIDKYDTPVQHSLSPFVALADR
jgi:hypothetical protein